MHTIHTCIRADLHTFKNINYIRTDVRQIYACPGQRLVYYAGVTGGPAQVKDLYESLGKVLPTWMTIQVVAIFIILLIMTRSIVIPLKAVILSVLSLGCTFGILVLIFVMGDAPTQSALDFAPTGS